MRYKLASAYSLTLCELIIYNDNQDFQICNKQK